MHIDLTQLPAYTSSRLTSQRRFSRVVRIGELSIGGSYPVAVQSMTTTPTQDVAATVAQAIRLAEAGCQVVRITAQNLAAARALKDIRVAFSKAGFSPIPLVADIHFLPSAALEAAEHVEKVRINPGNYADKKKFQQRAYSDAEYAHEIDRLYEAFTPIVLKCRQLGRAMRIGTNHGSLSDRIMNRYGDTPLGMCESALEFLRIAESHGFHDIVLSMKASNPKVAIQAYRLMVAKMAAENMHYPLHLGVTEAGDGDDARIKSAIGIGTLLFDGLGDTIRVSLTEDPVAEIPVAQALAAKTHALWQQASGEPEKTSPGETGEAPETCDIPTPYAYTRRPAHALQISPKLPLGGLELPRVIHKLRSSGALDEWSQIRRLCGPDAPVEGLLIELPDRPAAIAFTSLARSLNTLPPSGRPPLLVLDLSNAPGPGILQNIDWQEITPTATVAFLISLTPTTSPRRLKQWLTFTGQRPERLLIIDTTAGALASSASIFPPDGGPQMIVTASQPDPRTGHPLGTYRALTATLRSLNWKTPLWIRATEALRSLPSDSFGDRLLDASILIGGLLADGLGDAVSVESVTDPALAHRLAYNILQGARSRSVKTEYVACPSCGRTLFDLESTTARIRAATGHLKGVTIAVMGCIVNGPGEMADADFGYVGGAPGKINLYVGKTPVAFNIAQSEAVERLVNLIHEHGRWVDPPPPEAPELAAAPSDSLARQ